MRSYIIIVGLILFGTVAIAQNSSTDKVKFGPEASVLKVDAEHATTPKIRFEGPEVQMVRLKQKSNVDRARFEGPTVQVIRRESNQTLPPKGR